jgi:lysozyme
MKINLQRLLNDLKTDEGFSDKLYKCPTGKLTIGYGHNIEDNGISQVIAEQILVEDVYYSGYIAIEFVNNFYKLNDVRREVLINMAFNLGNRINQFKNLRNAIEQENFEQAGKEMLNSLWAKQVKGRADRLAKKMVAGA